LPRHVSEIEFPGRVLHEEFAFPVVRDEGGAQELRIGVDEEVELTEDGEPDVVRADD
jgi:hypothetical protein